MADISVASTLLKDASCCNVLADKGYDSQALLEQLEEQGCVAVIPPRKNRKKSREIDYSLYKERHLVECFFNKIKEFRKIATRYDKLGNVFLGFIHFASVLIWLR